jgi:hypothetical protein
MDTRTEIDGVPIQKAARIALEEAGLWYNMVEPFVRDKPIFARLNERLAELRRTAGPEDPYIGVALRVELTDEQIADIAAKKAGLRLRT